MTAARRGGRSAARRCASGAACAWIAAAAAVLACARGARAQPAPPSPAVDVVTCGAPAELDALERVLHELLGRLAVRVQWSRVERIDARAVLAPVGDARGAAVAHAWIDLSPAAPAGAARRATIFLGDRGGDRFLVRYVPLPRGLDEVEREQIAHLLESAVAVLIDGGEIGVSRADARAATLAPPPPSPPATRPTAVTPPSARAARPREVPRGGVRVDLGALYEASVYAPQGWLAHGPALSLAAAARRGALRPAGWLTAQYRVPLAYASDPVGARLDTVALRALAAIEGTPADGWLLRAALGGGVDLVQVQPTLARGAQAALEPARLIALPIVRAAASVHVRLVAGLALFAAVGCDLEPTGTHYDVIYGDATVPVIAPFPLRPFALLGLSVALVGAPRDEFARQP